MNIHVAIVVRIGTDKGLLLESCFSYFGFERHVKSGKLFNSLGVSSIRNTTILPYQRDNIFCNSQSQEGIA
jgi:hypothetical protein